MSHSAFALTVSLLLVVLSFGQAQASELAIVDSLYLVAEDAYLGGDFERAARGYSNTLARIEAHADGGGVYLAERGLHARFLMARSLEGAGRWDEAADAYNSSLAEIPLLSDFIRLRLARCHLERDDFGRTVELLREVVDAEERTTLHLSAVEQLGDSHAASGEYDVAVQWYRVLLREAPAYNDRARAHHKIGLALAKRGDRDSALASFAMVVEEFPRSPHAYDALKDARRSSRSFTDRYHQGLVLYNRKRYREAADFFNYYLRHNGEGEFRSQASYFLGRSHQRMGSYRSAARDYEDVIEYGPCAEHFDLAWSKLAYCKRATGRVEASLTTYDEFVALYPERDWAPDALWEKGRLLEEKLRWDEAVAAFADLAERYPDSTRAPEALFRRGLCLFKLGRYADADAAFADLSIGRHGEEAARSLFWAGKSREELGEFAAAGARYQDAVEAARDSYYGRRSLYRLDGDSAATQNYGGGVPRKDRPEAAGDRSGLALPGVKKQVGTGGQAGLPFRRISGLQAFAAWLAEWYHLVYLPGERIELVRLLRSDPVFRRADSFMAFHMIEEAKREFSLLEDAYGSDPRVLDILIGYYEDAGLHKRAIRMAEWILELSPAESLSDAPSYLRGKICPTHFDGIVSSECGGRGIDPDVFYSLIRQESLFEPNAVSWVGARGLSQIMPATGRWVARKLGRRAFRTSDLMDPETNIQFGTYYLSVQLEDFEGDVMRALAAYNGGPENVERWWEYGGGRDQDVFVEDIGFAQTREYVRRVYLYGEFYKELSRNGR